MNLNEWIKWVRNEVRLAQRYAENSVQENWEYVIARKSLQKIFERMDGIPDIKFENVRDHIIDLLYDRPLTPILNVDSEWDLPQEHEAYKFYQCNRYPSLSKRVYTDGSEKYVDSKRYICININDSNENWIGGIGGRILEEMHPIIFPYMPSATPIKVFMDKFLYHKEREDDKAYDTMAVTHFMMPDETIEEVHRFFKITEKKDNHENILASVEEITKNEYFFRKRAYIEREEKDEK